MNWFLGTLLLVLAFYILNRYWKKKKRSKLTKNLFDNWGKPKQDEYFNFYSIRQYFDNNTQKEEAHQIISEHIKNDLDLEPIFAFIDRTTSKIGQQYLYYKLRTIQSVEKLNEFDRLSHVFKTNSKLRLQAQITLSYLNTHDAYDLEKLVNDAPIQKPTYIKYVYLLAGFALIAIVSSFFYPLSLVSLVPIFFINTVIHYRNKAYVSYFISAVSQLNKTLEVAKNLAQHKEIQTHFKDFTFIKKVNAIGWKTKFISFEKQMSNEFQTIFWLFIELIKIQFNIESILFFNFTDAIEKEKPSIDKLFQFIGEIDVAISVASLHEGAQQICKPIFTKKNELEVTEISHPLLTDCITNDLHLNQKSLLLTGSNMSGKTTFIRTLAINSILAQSLNICFAKSYKAPFMKIYSAIRIADDLLEDTSYYLQEVLSIKKLIDASEYDDPCLFVLDEIFKGTNTVERISGGKAILSYLNKPQHFVLVSTHDIELTDMLEKDAFELYHFTEKVEEDVLFFDHKLKKGKLKTRNAIRILELYGYPKEVISEARKTKQEKFD